MFEIFTWWGQILPEEETLTYWWKFPSFYWPPCSWVFSHFPGENLEVSGKTIKTVWPMPWLYLFAFFLSVLHITYLKNHVESGGSKRKYYKTDIEVGKKSIVSRYSRNGSVWARAGLGKEQVLHSRGRGNTMMRKERFLISYLGWTFFWSLPKIEANKPETCLGTGLWLDFALSSSIQGSSLVGRQ